VKTAAPNPLMSDLSDYIRSRMGMSFPPERWEELEQKMSRAATTYGFPDAASCVGWILASSTDNRRLDVLAGALTVGETFFFRENAGLRALRERAFPAIVTAHAKGDRRIRIWCAGCCTGEEPYSVAMIASESPVLWGWEVSVLATDINEAFLSKAEAGIYSEWSFRGVEPATKEKFFRRRERSTFEVLPGIRKMVSFAYLNLIDASYPSLFNNTNAIDIVLCRNVLMYFTPDHARMVLDKLGRSLVRDGWLLVSPVEASLVDRSTFEPLSHYGALSMKKAPAQRTQEPTMRAPASHPRRHPLVRERRQPAVSHALAKERYAAAEYDGAIEILAELATKPMTEPSVFELLARACANAGRLSEAEQWCRRAIAAEKMSAAKHYLMALIRIEQQRPGEAVSDLHRALYLDPDLVVAHFTLATVCRREKKPREAARHLRNALLVLRGLGPKDVLPESEGMTAEKMIELIQASSEERENGPDRD
jgi:chemotaxis protein methyltransferase CheR